MIVTAADFPGLRGLVAMVDGGFDPIHAGHVAYFREAAALGAPVLCNVAGDEWVGRKHRPLLPQGERVAVLDAFRDVAYVHASATSTAEVLEALAPRWYVKGLDWEGRLPAEEFAACERSGTEIVFLDTVLGSSTAILERYERARQRD